MNFNYNVHVPITNIMLTYRTLLLHVEGVLADQIKVDESSREFVTENDKTQTDKSNAFVVNR